MNDEMKVWLDECQEMKCCMNCQYFDFDGYCLAELNNGLFCDCCDVCDLFEK